MSDTVRLRIKIEGSDSFKEVETSADELAKAIGQVKEKAHDLNERLLNANQISQAFEQVGAAVQSLQSVMHDLTETYAVQAAAEARLEQMMRNAMDATEDEIQSIKDLASAQQKLGVIGDEVILSGAQELATYMQKRESLEALIPVMDDMIAQQYGYNASAESAVSVAQMLGKVFAGETGALKRLGYTFDEAQEAVLKYGTEEEKVVMLTEVVGRVVDGTNAKLAATPYGGIVKARNAFGDLKEAIGRTLAPAMTVVDTLAKLSIAIMGIGKGIGMIKAVRAAVTSLTSSLRTATAAQRGLNAAMKSNVFILLASAVATVVLSLLEFNRESKEAERGMELLVASSKRAMQKFEEEGMKLQDLIATIEDECSSRMDQVEAIERLKSKYPELVNRYIDEKGRITDLIGLQKELNRLRAGEKHQIEENTLDDYKKKLSDYKRLEEQRASGFSGRDPMYNSYAVLMEGKGLLESEETFYKRMITHFEGLVARQQQVVNRNKRTEWKTLLKGMTDEELQKQRTEIVDAQEKYPGYKLKDIDREHLADIDAEIEARKNATQANTWQEMSYLSLGKAIEEQTKRVKELAGVDDDAANKEKSLLDAMQARYQKLGEEFGFLKNHVKTLGNEIRRASVDLVPMLNPQAPSSIDEPKENYATAPAPFNNVQTLAHYNKAIADLEEARLHASKEQLPIIDGQIALVKSLRDEFEGVNNVTRQIDISKGWSGLKGIGNSIRDIRDALTDTDNAWDALTQTIDGFISIFQSLQQVTEIIDTITAATQSMKAVSNAATQAELANAGTKVAANTAVAGSGAASAMASIPVVGPVLAIAAMTSVLAALASLPKFANGGLVYGPTLGLMGEYGGAKSNPEVIAPLSRLRAMLGEGGGGRSEVKFRIEGRELVGIMNKQNNIYRRSE